MTENAPAALGGLQHVTTCCGQCSCGCPELWVDPAADDDRAGVLDGLVAVPGLRRGSSAPLRAADAR